MKTKSDKNNNIDSIMVNDKILTDDTELCEAFYLFFSSIVLTSKLTRDDSQHFIFHLFRNIKTLNQYCDH